MDEVPDRPEHGPEDRDDDWPEEGANRSEFHVSRPEPVGPISDRVRIVGAEPAGESTVEIPAVSAEEREDEWAGERRAPLGHGGSRSATHEPVPEQSLWDEFAGRRDVGPSEEARPSEEPTRSVDVPWFDVGEETRRVPTGAVRGEQDRVAKAESAAPSSPAADPTGHAFLEEQDDTDAGAPSVRLTGEPGNSDATHTVDPVAPGQTAVPAAIPTPTELPHWTEPPTGQVPAVLSRDDGGENASPTITGPMWREGDADWEAHEEEFEPAMLAGEEVAVGSLDETDRTDADRRPWEFDLEPTRHHVAPEGPMTEPVESTSTREAGTGGEAVGRPGGPEVERGVEGDRGARPMSPTDPETAPHDPRSTGGQSVPSGGLLADDAGPDAGESSSDEALFTERPRPSGIPRVGRTRRNGLRPQRLRAKRPDDVDTGVDTPLAAEPPGASVTDVPGAGRRRGGLAGLAAADRTAGRSSRPEGLSGEAPEGVPGDAVESLVSPAADSIAPPRPDEDSDEAGLSRRDRRDRRGRRGHREGGHRHHRAGAGDAGVEHAGRRFSLIQWLGLRPPAEDEDPVGATAPGPAVADQVVAGAGPTAAVAEPAVGGATAAGSGAPSASSAESSVPAIDEGDADQAGGGPPDARRAEVGAVLASARAARKPPSSTGVRVGTGLAVAVIALVAFKLGTVPSLILSAVVVTVAAGECFGVLRRAGYYPATLLGLVGTVVLIVGAYTKGVSALPLLIALVVVFTFIWYLVGAERGSPVAGAAATFLTFGWVSVLGSYAGLLLAPSAFPNRNGIALLLGAVIATVANDVGAFLIGRWLGNHPLAPSISPGKTWEGLLGGAVVSIVVSAIVVGSIHPWSASNAALLGLVVAVVAPLGDLCESLLKRDLRLKDMGSLLPGHGGVLDRVDALLFVLPATYYLVRALNIS